MYERILFPGVPLEHWQMTDCERIALTGVLSRIRPRFALEIGTYYGGSLTLISQYAEHILAIDIDSAVRARFNTPANAEIWIGSSAELIQQALQTIKARGIPLQFVLIDADHSTAGVKRDIGLVLQYRPSTSMVILIHDSGNPGCRNGILSADWESNPHVHLVECDFVPGQVIEHSVANGTGEVWGGFAMAYLDGNERTGPVQIRQSAKTSIECVHRFMSAAHSS